MSDAPRRPNRRPDSDPAAAESPARSDEAREPTDLDPDADRDTRSLVDQGGFGEHIDPSLKAEPEP